MYGIHDSLWDDHFNNSQYENKGRRGEGCGPTAKKCRYCGKEDLWFYSGILKERVNGVLGSSRM